MARVEVWTETHPVVVVQLGHGGHRDIIQHAFKLRLRLRLRLRRRRRRRRRWRRRRRLRLLTPAWAACMRRSFMHTPCVFSRVRLALPQPPSRRCLYHGAIVGATNHSPPGLAQCGGSRGEERVAWHVNRWRQKQRACLLNLKI